MNISIKKEALTIKIDYAFIYRYSRFSFYHSYKFKNNSRIKYNLVKKCSTEFYFPPSLRFIQVDK